jgi:hypothetical protein
MATTQIAYETETGRILAIHHFQGEPEDPERLKQTAANTTEVPENGITIMSVQPGDIYSERNYRVDHERNALIEVPDGEGGVRFSFEEVLPPT